MRYSSAAQLVRRNDEKVSGTDCYVLENASQGMAVWIGKHDFLLRRYKHFIPKSVVAESMKQSRTNVVPEDITHVETHESIIVNEPLSKEAFLPAGSAASK
jgi:hypothetical protein